MTTDSVWLIERVEDGDVLGFRPFPTKREAMHYVRMLKDVGSYRAVEYRRVKEGE